jgi:hypothetical protein
MKIKIEIEFDTEKVEDRDLIERLTSAIDTLNNQQPKKQTSVAQSVRAADS